MAPPFFTDICKKFSFSYNLDLYSQMIIPHKLISYTNQNWYNEDMSTIAKKQEEPEFIKS